MFLNCFTLMATASSPSDPELTQYEAWQSLLNQRLPSLAQSLEVVNQFANQFEYAEDTDVWSQREHWATPKDFIMKGRGDCEDYVFLKYFTLIGMGIDPAKLRITYVKDLELNQAHMVLAVYRAPNTEPLILDNKIDRIKLASQRLDLKPIYSFNGIGMWQQSREGASVFVGEVSGFGRWQQYLKRMEQQGLLHLVGSLSQDKVLEQIIHELREN